MENCDADVDRKLIRTQARYPGGGGGEAGIIRAVECDEATRGPRRSTIGAHNLEGRNTAFFRRNTR